MCVRNVVFGAVFHVQPLAFDIANNSNNLTRLRFAMVGSSRRDVLADGIFIREIALRKPFAIVGPADDCLVQHAAGFFRHPEASLVNLRVDFLGRVSHERQFEIVNDPGAVHGHGRHDPLLHEVHENRTQSDFDDVGADSHDDRPAFRWAFATALATARNVFTPRISGSER